MKSVIVTGASSGIGQAIYYHFKNGLNLGRYDVVYGISRHGPDIKRDLSQPYSIPWNNGPVVLLINCAGVMPLGEEFPDTIFNTNFWGTYYMIESVLPHLTDKSCIINIASVSGLRGDKELPIYAASKAAIISLTQSFAKALAPKTRVNCISPGYYKTNLVPGNLPQELINTIPLKYEEKPENLIRVVRTIWDTEYMTGTNIVVDGGVSL